MFTLKHKVSISVNYVSFKLTGFPVFNSGKSTRNSASDYTNYRNSSKTKWRPKMSHANFGEGFWKIKIWIRSSLLPILYQKNFQDIICILEREEKHNSYKIIRNKNNFSLIAKFGDKNAEMTPLKNNAFAKTTARYLDKKQVSFEDKLCKSKRKRGKKQSSPRASGKSSSQHTDKNQDSFNVGQAEQPNLKKKKTPAQVARDRDRRKSYWKRIKLARQLRKAKLRAENLTAY